MARQRKSGRTRRFLARRGGAAAAALLWSVAAGTQATAANAVILGTENNNKTDQDGVCKWEDEAGAKKCKQQAAAAAAAAKKLEDSDPSLPSSEGGRDYIDNPERNIDAYYESAAGYYGNSGNDDDVGDASGEAAESELKAEPGDEYGGESNDPESEHKIKSGEESGDESGDETEQKPEWENYENYHEYVWEHYRSFPAEGEEWELFKHGRKSEFYQELECPDFDYEKEEMFKETSFESIHNTETWKTFNKVYNEVIAATKLDPDLAQESTIPPQYETHGFQFPIEIRFDPIVGRGVFAKTDIPKGSLLYISTNNAAFYNGQTFRNFLKALPSKLACDVLIWAFARWVSLETAENEKHMVCVDLDEGSFVNSADEDEAYNMALGTDEGVSYMDATMEEQMTLWYGCKMKFFAHRDIRAGEEIRAVYSDFAELDGWTYLGL